MELVQKIDARTRACATLEEDGTLSIKTFASADYAPGAATTAEVSGEEIDPIAAERIREGLSLALAGAQVKLGGRLGKAIHKSAEVAAQHNEI